MRALRLQWSRAISLVCEVALTSTGASTCALKGLTELGAFTLADITELGA
jgi:hypothetical protein